tara:strand:+ start:278 stop:1507 length:1230 start_codon:yes stop_codon:yes gene_type:complete
MKNILSWEELNQFKAEEIDKVNGETNSYTDLRLFGHDEKDAKLIFYRDRHAWCPYCQKIWLWLEQKKIPYRVKKINMYCYGKKENWFLNKVGSGKLPAIELDGQVVTESDDILYFLERVYGVLGSSISSQKLLNPRKIERNIFRAWCEWLCRDNYIFSNKSSRKKNLYMNLKMLEDLLSNSKTGFIDPNLESSGEINMGTGDIVFIPYIERLNASLCYYKGFSLREEFPLINNWFTLLENQTTYLGTQGDFHTHAHDLPPQMGGCYKDINEKQIDFERSIDLGNGLGNLEINSENNLDYYSRFALMRVMKHKDQIINVNPCKNNEFEISLRSALTFMITGEIIKPNYDCGEGLRYLRDRISVPRDMPILSARIFRQSLEKIASLSKSTIKLEIPTKHRYDQDPDNFISR